MTSDPIKPGAKVVSDFLDSLKATETIDDETLGIIIDLYKKQKLGKNPLLRVLEERRQLAIQPKKNN